MLKTRDGASGRSVQVPVFTLSYVAARHGPGLRDCSTDHLTAVVELRDPGPMSVEVSTAASNKGGDRVADRETEFESGLPG